LAILLDSFIEYHHLFLSMDFSIFDTEVMECIECGETFLGRNTKFCSMKCYKKNVNDSKNT